MKTYILVSFLIFLGLFGVSPGTLAKDKIYTAKNGAFTVAYPDQIKTKVKAKKRRGFLSVDFIEKSRQLPSYALTTYSIEWTSAEAETEENFLAQWKDFVPTYFAKNFGKKAQLELVKLRAVTPVGNYKGYEYVGQGLLNDGKTLGNINVVTFKTQGAICTIYQISVIAEEKQKTPFSKDNFQYERFQRFVSSFKVNEKGI